MDNFKIKTLITLLILPVILIASGVSFVFSDPYGKTYSGPATVLTNSCSIDGKVIFSRSSGESYESFRNRCDSAMSNNNSPGKSDRSYDRTGESIKFLKKIVNKPSSPKNQSNQSDDALQSIQSPLDLSKADNPFDQIHSTPCVDLQQYKATKLTTDLNYAVKIEESIPDAIALLKEVENDVSFYKSTVELADGMKVFLQSTKLTTNLILNTLKTVPGEGEVADMIQTGSDALSDRELVGKFAEAWVKKSSVTDVSIVLGETTAKILKKKIGSKLYNPAKLFYDLAKDTSGIASTINAAEGVKNKKELIKRARSLRLQLEEQQTKLDTAQDTKRRLKLLSAEIDRLCPPMTAGKPAAIGQKKEKGKPTSDTDIF